MYTECPNCRTYFKVTPAQLKIADGKVRCGSCNHVFNAIAGLVEKVPPVDSDISTSQLDTSVESEQISGFASDTDISVSALAGADESIALPKGDESLPSMSFELEDQEVGGEISEKGKTSLEFELTDEDLSQLATQPLSEVQDALTESSSEPLDVSDIMSKPLTDIELEADADADVSGVDVGSDIQTIALSDIDVPIDDASDSSLSDEDLSAIMTQPLSDADSGLDLSHTSEIDQGSIILSEPDESAEHVSLALKDENASEGDDSLIKTRFIDSEPELALVEEEGPQISSASSFDDVEVPGNLELVDEAPSTSSQALKSSTELDDINKDIDAALNGLFNDEAPQNAKESSVVVKEDILQDESVSDLPDLDSEADLKNLDLSDSIQESGEIEANEPVAARETESTRQVKKQKEEESEFELGDSLLVSEATDMDSDDWAPASRSKMDQEKFTTDSYVLEEVDENQLETTSIKSNLSKFLWVAVIMLLLVVLIGEFAYVKRAELAKYPSVRPVLVKMCEVVGAFVSCEVPEPKDVNAIVILERNVVSHPHAKNALMITSTITSNADFVQPFPELVLTFSDINQKILAKRTFLPKEYLEKEVNISNGMQPGKAVKIRLEIVDPGEAAVNFEFSFR